jgi:hypothetical protein
MLQRLHARHSDPHFNCKAKGCTYLKGSSWYGIHLLSGYYIMHKANINKWPWCLCTRENQLMVATMGKESRKKCPYVTSREGILGEIRGFMAKQGFYDSSDFSEEKSDYLTQKILFFSVFTPLPPLNPRRPTDRDFAADRKVHHPRGFARPCSATALPRLYRHSAIAPPRLLQHRFAADAAVPLLHRGYAATPPPF